MGLQILIAFDDSANAMRAVDHVAGLHVPEAKVTLFSVLQNTAALCDMDSPELTEYFHKQQTQFCVLEDKKKELVVAAQEKAKAKLVAAGFKPANIALKTEPKKKGIARDIVAEAQQGYNMIVLGRRGISSIREFFLGSVSQKVLHLAKDMSILLVN